MAMTTDGAVRVVVEAGRSLSFASALDWPGWARSGRGEEAAVEALRAQAPRYAPVAVAAGLQPPDPARIEIVERLPGSPTTDFGALAAIADAERVVLSAAEAERLVRLLEAGWAVLDGVVANAPAGLRRGPRGGGRDRDAIVDHVLAAEAAYARKLGLRVSRPATDAPARAVQRRALADVLRVAAAPHPAGAMGWPPRYGIRRLAWHVLDHAWEIEDKSDPAPPG
jgi:hypothetical protein